MENELNKSENTATQVQAQDVISLDSFMENNGQAFNEDQNALISPEEILGEEGYKDTGVLPGQEVNADTSNGILGKEEAKQKIIQNLAMAKLKGEMDEMKKKSDKEKIHMFILQSEYRRWTNDFYAKHGYEMSGKQKRNLKRNIENAYQKGKYHLTEERKQDILYEMGKLSNEIDAQNKSSLDANAPVISLDSIIKPL